MPLTAEEFDEKICEIVGDTAVLLFKLFNPAFQSTPDYLNNIRGNWMDLTKRYLELDD